MFNFLKILKNFLFSSNKVEKEVVVDESSILDNNLIKCMNLIQICDDKIFNLSSELQAKSLSASRNANDAQFQATIFGDIEKIKALLVELSKQRDEINKVIEKIINQKINLKNKLEEVNSINTKSILNQIEESVKEVENSAELKSRIAKRKFEFFQDQQ